MQLICGKGRGQPDTNSIHPTRVGPSAGGAPIVAECNTFDAVTEIQVNVREHEGSIVVSQITLVCQATLDGSGRTSRVFGGGGGQDAGSSVCPANHYVAGFAGRSGTFVDAVGISVCRPRRALN
jgi:hypothetical protein